MNLLEEAIIYATVMHAGKKRKGTNTPYILHPLEVSQILSTMTDDIEVIAAGVLHDVIEDTDGSLNEIHARFGDRVAALVDSETENKYLGEDASLTWKKRKTEALFKLKNSSDIGVKMVWLADKLANIRSMAQGVRSQGDSYWNLFHQKDPEMHKWYYKSIADDIELTLNRTGAFKEYIEHINFLWPGTFKKEKSRYKKYHEISVDSLTPIGKGAKSTVYRYNDELIVKIYNDKNMFKDIEHENYLARTAFVAGIPTAISFGIVRAGDRYGSMFELLDSDTISNLIAKNPSNVHYYAKIMADLALQIHHTVLETVDIPDFKSTLYRWIQYGIAFIDETLSKKIISLVDDLPDVKTIIHGDFHTGNAILQNGECLLIDMDNLSRCHPIAELQGIYMSYIGFGALNPKSIEDFMGFSYDTSKLYFKYFLMQYLDTEDEKRIQDVQDKAALLCYVRFIYGCYKSGTKLSNENKKACDYYLKNLYLLADRIDSLDFLQSDDSMKG